VGASLYIRSNFWPTIRSELLVSTENPHHSTPENPNATNSDDCENPHVGQFLPALCKKMLVNCRKIARDCVKINADELSRPHRYPQRLLSGSWQHVAFSTTKLILG